MKSTHGYPILILSFLTATMISSAGTDGPISFAQSEIQAAARVAAIPKVDFVISRDELSPQAYRIEHLDSGAWRITAGDETGAMYGGLDIAEAIRLETLDTMGGRERSPHIANRGIKLNIPLDLRTPSYSDNSDAAQANIPVMWEREFWSAFLDDLARHRYNVLTLWSLHPFPSLVKVPEFPDVALDDVWRTRVKLDGDFSPIGIDMVKPEMLADHEVVKNISIDEKIDFWRWVMAYAKSRGVDVYLFTWNVFTWGAEGKHGITSDMDNPATKAYFRASVREIIKTYPLLAGFGITAGEGMPHGMASTVKEKWLWDTYGEGVRDALRQDPDRVVRMIHRFHWTAQSDIVDAWKEYPGFPETFEFSFKYSVAHMYSITNPPFIEPLIKGIWPGLRTWLTVRNDDIYTFRYGDPDFIRDYITHMPDRKIVGGFYMGPDGYTWGRDFLERNPAPGPRPLVMEKQWYSFMLVGRLGYDPTLSNAHFQRVLGARFPGADAASLFRLQQCAARTMPLITRFFWGDIDLKWYPEGSLSRPRTPYQGFYTVRHFVEGNSMPGSGVLNIRDWRESLNSGQPMEGMTPLEIASALECTGVEGIHLATALRDQNPDRNREFDLTLDDSEALGYLARYYAAKIRGACALALYDRSLDPTEKSSAIVHLTEALDHWRNYVGIRDRNYIPALYNRVEYVDLNALTRNVEADISLAQDWQTGTVPDPAPRPKDDGGFKK